MNVGVTPDNNGHYVVEAYLPDKEHPGYSKYQPLRKFMAQGDARLFADMIREHKLPTPAENYARTYDAKRAVVRMCWRNSGRCKHYILETMAI